LVDKYSSKEWLEPLLDEVGPCLQVQAADLADSLEITDNFVHWRNSEATRNVLCLLAALTLVVTFVDGRLLAQILWMGMGFVFFGCWPISALYPRYRLLVSPFKWLFAVRDKLKGEVLSAALQTSDVKCHIYPFL
jgi:hypothetical protein